MELLPDGIRLSILIPILNEAGCLDQSLSRLFDSGWLDPNCEVILCDGGSTDQSLQIAANHPCQVVESPPGRARQMNRAALDASGQYLLFLHADTELPTDFEPQQLEGASWGFFRLRLDSERKPFRVIEAMINWRTGLSRIAGGDQALFFEREFFRQLDGFPDIPLMEDCAICDRARKRASPRILQNHVTSSSRRWQNNGLVKTVVMMWSLRLAFWLGVSPHRLHRIYYPQRG